MPDGGYNAKALGISDSIRNSGKGDVIDTPQPHEPYGYFLNNQTVHTENGTALSGWIAHRACFYNDITKCDRTSYPDDLYEDNWVGANAIKLLERKPEGKPWFMHVSFPGPHPAFLVTGVIVSLWVYAGGGICHVTSWSQV